MSVLLTSFSDGVSCCGGVLIALCHSGPPTPLRSIYGDRYCSIWNLDWSMAWHYNILGYIYIFFFIDSSVSSPSSSCWSSTLLHGLGDKKSVPRTWGIKEVKRTKDRCSVSGVGAASHVAAWLWLSSTWGLAAWCQSQKRNWGCGGRGCSSVFLSGALLHTQIVRLSSQRKHSIKSSSKIKVTLILKMHNRKHSTSKLHKL